MIINSTGWSATVQRSSIKPANVAEKSIHDKRKRKMDTRLETFRCGCVAWNIGLKQLNGYHYYFNIILWNILVIIKIENPKNNAVKTRYWVNCVFSVWWMRWMARKRICKSKRNTQNNWLVVGRVGGGGMEDLLVCPVRETESEALKHTLVWK